MSISDTMKPDERLWFWWWHSRPTYTVNIHNKKFDLWKDLQFKNGLRV